MPEVVIVRRCKILFRHFINRLGAFACAAVATGLIVGASNPLLGQDDPSDRVVTDRLGIFLDCSRCYESFIREELTFVDHVRDRERADVHVLITRQGAGGGGTAHSFDLIGLGPFAGQDHSTVFVTSATDTDDEERRGLLRTLEISLVPYLMQTGYADRMSLVVASGGEREAAPLQDPWRGWTIRFYGNGSGRMEATQYDISLRYGFFADHVSEAWKMRVRPYFNYDFDQFERNEETITSTSRRDGLDTYVIKSISPHWSVGLFADVFTSTFSNIDLRFRGRPAVEYSVFPYREASRRQLTFAYLVGATQVRYSETTIFDQDEEFLTEHALDVEYEVTQPWGGIDVGIQASQYFHDPSKYRVEFSGQVDVRVTQGLSINFGGRADLIHDQLNLPKGDATLEETLLRRRQLATNYQIRGSVGFSYRIGSIYNNVVNPRF